MILVDATGVAVSRPGKPLFTRPVGDRGERRPPRRGRDQRLRQVDAAAGAGRQPREPEGGHGAARPGRPRLGPRPGRPLPAGTVAEVVGEGWEGASVLDRLGMGGALDTDVATLSGGQVKRVALARALVSGSAVPGATPTAATCSSSTSPPTTSTSTASPGWRTGWPASRAVSSSSPTTATCSTGSPRAVLELDRGKGYVHVGGYQSWLDARAEREEQAAGAETKRRNLARAELAWLRRGAPARTRKPQARIESATALVQGRPEAAARSGRPAAARRDARLGDQVVELHGVGDGYGDRWLFRGVDLALDPRERLGIVGANGVGKSTLLDVIAGRRQPREGRVVTGSTAQLAVYDQRGASLDPTKRVREAIAGPDPAAGLDRRPPARGVLVRRRRAVGADQLCCPAGSAGGCSCCSRWPRSRTCCCSTSPPTTSTSTRCARSRTSSTTGPAR